jgi:glycosyltransferase involved in cell wall biosynthesis
MKDKKIKVYLQYPWKVSDSQYYKSIIENPPKNVVYKNVRKKEGMIVSKKFLLFNFIKRQIRSWTEKFNVTLPNSRLTKTNEEFDLIHCAHCLSKNTNKPWVADFESWWQMWISGRETKRGHEEVLKLLKRDACKKIIAWTPYVKQEIEKQFPEIKDKIEIVTYAIPFKKFEKKEKKQKVLLFVSRYFFEKGGLHTLEVFDRITKKEKDVEAIFVSNTPSYIRERYFNNKKIKIYDLMPYSNLVKDIFPMADIFVYPGYSDTFGFTFVDALAFGLPIITIEGFSRRYLVNDKKTGFVIKKEEEIDIKKIGINEEKLIQEMIKKTLEMLKNEKLLKEMSRNCIEEVEHGKFSIKERNKKLKRIYELALK